MKYMSFTASCSYCCLANLLEMFGVEKEDRDIALEMGLPYLFSRDGESGSYLAGAMLQGKDWFNDYLNSIGFDFFEDMVEKEQTIRHLEEHIPCMVGLKGDFGRHAMIFKGHQNGEYRFMNPHREGDGQPDEVVFSEGALLEALSEVNAVGYILPGKEPVKPDRSAFQSSLSWLRRWRDEIREFCGQPRTRAEIMAAVDPLFRPLAVDGLAMMELIGEQALAEGFRIFQQQAMALFRAGDCCPDGFIDQEHVSRITAAYADLIGNNI